MRHPVVSYLLSLAAVAVAALVLWALDTVLGETLPVALFFAAVAAAVWLGGYRAGLLASVASYLAADYFFIAPRGTLELSTTSDIAGAAAFAFTSVLIIAFGEAMRTAQRRSHTE